MYRIIATKDNQKTLNWTDFGSVWDSLILLKLKIFCWKVKINWNSTVKLINSTKKYGGALNSSKNELNIKIS